MNIITRVVANATGLLSPTRQKREAAAADVTSLARAGILGRLKMLGAVPKAGSAAAKALYKAEESSATGQELGQDAFLELLVTELQHQDPLAPVDNAQMMAQLAQFSALEQMTKLNTSFEQLSESIQFMSGNIDQANFINAASLVGRQVKGVDLNGAPVEGEVESVYMEDSMVYLTVDGNLMSMAGVISIEAS